MQRPAGGGTTLDQNIVDALEANTRLDATSQEISDVLQGVADQYATLNKPMKLATYCLMQQTFFGDSISVNKVKNLLLTCTPEQRTAIYSSLMTIYQTEHLQQE